MTDQTTFEFDASDLEVIHEAVSRWCRDHGISVSHKRALLAARQAFRLYQPNIGELELANSLHMVLNIRH